MENFYIQCALLNNTRLYWLAAVLDVRLIKAGWLTNFGEDERKFHEINQLVPCSCHDTLSLSFSTVLTVITEI